MGENSCIVFSSDAQGAPVRWGWGFSISSSGFTGCPRALGHNRALSPPPWLNPTLRWGSFALSLPLCFTMR